MIDSLGSVQSVLLIGGTSEIGLAILERLAQGGRLQRIVFLGRNEQALERTAESWRDRGMQTQVILADLSGELDVPVLTERCFDSGDLDVVVFAAGITPDSSALLDQQGAREVAMVNFVSQMQLGTEIVQRLRLQGHGALVVLSSVAGERPRADNYLYGATKAGLDAWANGLADALAGEPVRILVVRPGMVRTRMSAGHKEAPFTCDPEDVAEAVAKNLRSGPVTVWVPPQLRYLMSGLRHTPRPVFRRLSAMR
ncbi:MAG: SDR family NAD(P)-dependent oxidoreductase [Candidatus Nanopelagicales bacterium]